MKIFWQAALALAIIGVALMTIVCSDKGTHLDNKDYFEVREWGVMVGCETDTSYYLTSRPEQASLVRVPVIYFHSTKKTPFSATVTFNTGKPDASYPPGDIVGNVLRWPEVSFVTSYGPDKRVGFDDFVPLESILETLNNVDADLLQYKGQYARFLFYEGAVEFSNKVRVSYDLDSLIVHLENTGRSVVQNIMLSIALPNAFNSPTPLIFTTQIAQLNPGQKINAILVQMSEMNLTADMLAQGFSQSEAASFTTLWQRPFFQPDPVNGWANLVYRIPQQEYDSLVSLSIIPTPTKTTRALYVMVHLGQAMQADTSYLRFLAGKWNWVRSCGGFFGGCMTPVTEGYNSSVFFTSDSLYVRTIDDSISESNRYSIVKLDIRGHVIPNVILIDNHDFRLTIWHLSADSLVLADLCSDCYVHTYYRD